MGKKPKEDLGNVGKLWWFPIYQFFIHTLVSTVIFILIASVAVLLGGYVTWLGTFNVSVYILFGLESTKYFLFCADILLFCFFITKKTLVAARAI